MSQKKDAPEKLIIAGTIISFAVSAVLIKLSGLSVSAIVSLIATLVKMAIIGSGSGSSSGASADTLGSIGFFAGYFFNAFLSFIFITLGFSFLAASGYRENKKNMNLVLPAVGALIFFFVLGFTLASFIVALGIFLSSYSVMPMANNYGKELKKWVRFRVGSNTVSRALFLLNIMIALSVFLAVLLSMQTYEASFKYDLRESMSLIIMGNLPAGADPLAVSALVNEKLDEFMASSLIAAYIRWLPVVSAFSAWALLEILRLFLPFVAGAFTSAMLRLEKEKN